MSLKLPGVSRAFFPMNPKPAECFENILDILGTRSDRIQIIDSKSELASGLSDQCRGEQKVKCIPQVQKATRGGRKSRNQHCFNSLSGIHDDCRLTRIIRCGTATPLEEVSMKWNALVFAVALYASHGAFAHPLGGVLLDLPARYGVQDLYTKVVDNRGEGEENLYGVRNARILFRNVMRGGANNAYHRHHRRENQNPLPDDGLKNLCEEGFTDAIYLYPKNFNTAPSEVNCVRADGSKGRLKYHNWIYNSDEKVILKTLHGRLSSGEGAVYLHCWNGWHASGYISAISLIQFCGTNPEAAIDYWNRNTDGVNQGANYDRIRNKIKNFRPSPDLLLDAETRQRVCIN
jgi:hypothetical protein